MQLARTETVGAVLARIRDWVQEKMPEENEASGAQKVFRGRMLRLAHGSLRPDGSLSQADAVREAGAAAGLSVEEAEEAASGLAGGSGEGSGSGPWVLPGELALSAFTPVQLRGLVLLNLPDPGY